MLKTNDLNEAQFPEDQLAKFTKFIGFLKLTYRVHSILNMIDWQD